ncbi:MAG: N-acetyltransferase [Treponema sp.]|nr:N-acetyltransferase [Treponema sp.]MCL2251742.1 N-acetyltransferase [Treponema sp.]
MEIKIRLETENDYYEVENLTREAFWVFPGREDGCDEHYLVYKLRTCPDFIKELDYVALIDDKITGNIMYSKCKIIDTNNIEHEIITFGPVSVLPLYQKKGIGTKLINFTLEKARELGYRAVMIYGHPEYYPRFGFKDAKEFNITTHDGKNFDAFMICELYKDALAGISGKGYISPVYYDLNADDVKEFDKKFSPK